MKLISWTCGILVLLMVLVLVAAKLLVTPEAVRRALLPLAEEKLGRPIEISEIRIDIFSGITLENIAIASSRNGHNLFEAKKAVLRYQFWPLLTGQVMVDRILLQEPRLTLQRNRDGAWNLADLFASAQDPKIEPAQKGPRMSVDESRSRAQGSDISLLITKLEMIGGQVAISDQMLNPEAPYRFELKDVGLTVQNFSMERPVQIRAVMSLGTAPMEVSGALDPTGQNHDLTLKMTHMDLGLVSPYLKDLLPGIFSRAYLTSDIRFTGNPERFALKGRVALDDIYLVLDALQDAPIRGTSLSFEPDLGVDLEAGLLTVRPSRVAIEDVSFQLSGGVEKIEVDPFLDLKLSWQDVGVRDIFTVVPPGILPRLDQVDPGGRLSGSLSLRGSSDQPAKLVQAGRISLADVQVNLGPARPALTGDFNLVGAGLASDNLELRLGDDVATIKMTISDLTAERPVVQHQVAAQKIDLDRVVAALGSTQTEVGEKERQEKLTASPEGDVAAKMNPKSSSKPQDAGPIDLPLALDGSLRADEVLYHGLVIANLDLGYRLAENVLDVRRMSGALAGGTFAQTGKVDLRRKGLPFQSQLKLSKVDAGQLINALLPDMQGTLTGELTLENSLSGKGTTETSIKKHLSGNGHFNLTNGVLSGTKLSRGLVGLLGMDQLDQISLQQAEGTYQIKQGRVDLSGVVAGRDLQMAPKGKVQLAGPLSISLPTRLAPRAAAGLGKSSLVSRLLKDDEGWTIVPLKVKGTIENPKVAIDEKQLGRQAEKKLKQKLEQKLLEKLAPAPKEGEQDDPTRKAIQDTLRGLFGN